MDWRCVVAPEVTVQSVLVDAKAQVCLQIGISRLTEVNSSFQALCSIVNCPKVGTVSGAALPSAWSLCGSRTVKAGLAQGHG